VNTEPSTATIDGDIIAKDAARDPDTVPQQFAAEQEAIFARWLEEGCNLFV